MSLAKGDTFPSFEAFREAMKKYEKTIGVLFVTYGSVKNHDASTNTKFPYQSVRYECKQGKIRASTSKGLRTNLSSYKQDCTAAVRAQLQREGTVCMKITIFREEHNHPVSKEIASLYPENRNNKPDGKEAIKLQTLKPVKVEDDQQHSNKKNVVPRNRQNLKQKDKPVAGSDDKEIQTTLASIKNNGGMYHILKTEEGSLLSLSFQTKEQLSLLEKYPEVIVMDIAYKTNSYLMPLLTIHAIDSNNRGIPIFHSYIRNETEECLIPVMEKFKQGYPCDDKTLLFVVDKDFSEINALRKTFPAVPIHMCAFHATSAVKKALSKYLIDKVCQDTVLNLFIKQRTTIDEEEYESLKSSISNLMPTNAGRQYFQKSWWAKPELWAFAKSEALTTFGVNTTNHAELYHQRLKVFLNIDKSLPESIKVLLKYNEDIFKACLDMNNKVLIKRQYHTQDKTTEAKDIFDSLVPFAARIVHTELQIARRQNARTKDTTTSSQCCCFFYTTYNLPCRHIFKFRITNDLPIFTEDICSLRFHKSNLHNNGNDIPIPRSSAVVQNVSKKVRTVEDKYKWSQALMKEFSSYMCLLGTEEFELKNKVLLDLLLKWKHGHHVVIRTEQPEFASSIPLIKTEHDEIATSIPLVQIEQDEIVNSIPQIKIEQDEIATRVPLIKTVSAEIANSVPQVRIERDEIATSIQVQIQKPVIANSVPQVQIQKPEIANSVPQVQIQKPVIANSVPQVQIQKPEIANSVPQVQIQKPEIANSVPQVQIQKPVIANSVPLVQIQQSEIATSIVLIKTEPAEIANSIPLVQQEFDSQHHLEENGVHFKIESPRTVFQLEIEEEHPSSNVMDAPEPDDGDSEVMHRVQPTVNKSNKLLKDFQSTTLTKFVTTGQTNQKQIFTKRKRKRSESFSSFSEEQKKRILFKTVIKEES